jgi:hypothetical protein
MMPSSLKEVYVTVTRYHHISFLYVQKVSWPFYSEQNGMVELLE